MSEEIWLVVAADKQELSGLLRKASQFKRLRWPVTFAAEGAFSGRRAVLVANGPGLKLAGEAACEALKRRPSFSRILSVGLCGALHPDYKVGDVFAASEVVDEAGGRFPAAPPRASRPFHQGVLVSIDRVAQTATEKQQLRRRYLADAVEMEAAAVAARARRAGLPFHCVRVVSDAAAEDFRIDLNAARSPDGRFCFKKVVLSALKKPWVSFPELLRLVRVSRRAAGRLGDFLAECQF